MVSSNGWKYRPFVNIWQVLKIGNLILCHHVASVFEELVRLVAGEVGRMYEANVDDIGCRLVAVYTPVRDDGVGGAPVSASTDPIAVGWFRKFHFLYFKIFIDMDS